MGTIRKGANGGFSGKAGSVVGSSWNNIDYIKGLPKLIKRQASIKQLDQRARFAAALKYLGPIKDILMKGYRGQTSGRTTGFNVGVQHALSFAIIGTYPNYEVDKSLIAVSKGSIQSYKSVSASAEFVQGNQGSLNMTWLPQINALNAFADDGLQVLTYNEQQNLFLFFPDAAERQDAAVSLELPDDYAGNTLHLYVFYVNREGTRQSNSVWLQPS
ncbi:MAG: hypothetical protein EOO90_13260 [Pedobacter sp.]|nr:MAG: hypothetical protein EOO90_13260 [Pedobacter sp.]